MGIVSMRQVKRLQKRGDVEGLIAFLLDDSRDGFDRRYAAVALGRLGDHRAVEALIRVLGDHRVRGLAAEALGAIGDLRAAGPILELASTSQNSIVVSSAQKAYVMLADKHGVQVKAAAQEYLDRRTAELARRRDTPVESWEDCPLCREPLTQKVKHAVRCANCERYFTDPNFMPIVSGEQQEYGHLEGGRIILLLPGIVPEDAPAAINMAWRLVREDYGTTQGKTVVVDEILMGASLRCETGPVLPVRN